MKRSVIGVRGNDRRFLMGVLECGVSGGGRNGVAGGVSTRLELACTIKLAELWFRLCDIAEIPSLAEMLPDAVDSWLPVIELFMFPVGVVLRSPKVLW